MNLLESTLVQKFGKGSLESQIVEASQRVAAALFIVGGMQEHVILATFSDHVIALREDGKIFSVTHGGPMCVVSELESVDPKATHFKAATRSVVEGMMRGESNPGQMRSLAANVGSASAQMIWEHKVVPLLGCGAWGRYFEANEATIRSSVWMESRRVRERKPDGWNLGGVEKALTEDLQEAGRLLPKLDNGSEMRSAVLAMLENGIAVCEGIKLLRGGRKAEEKGSDIIKTLLEYRGRIELMNAYTRLLASKQGS